MSNALLQLTSYVVNAFWQVAVLGAAGWVLSRCLNRTGPEMQHKLWVATLIAATLVPATPILQSYFMYEALTREVIVSDPPMLTPFSGGATGSDIVFSLITIYLISGLYIAGLLFFGLRLCWVVHRTAALVRNARPASIEPDCAALWHSSKETFSVQMAGLLASRDIPGPVTTGFWRPVLLLPGTFFENHSRKEFLAVIGHECAYIKRNDFWKNVFYEIVSLFTAFHPVTWFIKSRIAQTREMICDRMAAEQLLDRRSYAISLLQLAGKMPLPPRAAVSRAMGMFDTNILERRIMTLTTSQPKVSRVQRYLSGLMAALLLLACATVSGSLTQSVASQTSKSTDPAESAGKRQASSKDLSCTYYEDGKGSPGTCGFDKRDKKKYRCYSNEDPARSNPQIACEWKVLRALGSHK